MNLKIIPLVYLVVLNQVLTFGQNTFPATGNVGIGTTTPTSPLMVNTSVQGIAAFKSTGAANSWITISNTTGQSNWGIGSITPHPYIWSNTNKFFIGSDGTPTLVVSGMANGNVGIGTLSPISKLTVVAGAQNDGIWETGTGVTKIALLNNITTGAYNSLSQNGDNLLVWTGSTVDAADAGGLVIGPWTGGSLGNGIRITAGGNVGVGIANPGPYRMAVEGTLGARKVKITQVMPWADYVFDSGYKLRTLEEVESFIMVNKHLPEVPTTKEVEKDGLDVGDNQALLLKKIEELTLYVIELKKENQHLFDEIEKIKSGIHNTK